VIRNNNGSGVFLFSKEGITQGDPFLMFAYGVGILLLICRLKQEFPAAEQPWSADDAGAGGKFDAIWYLFLWLQEIGPSYDGYFPELSKSALIVPMHSLDTVRTVFADLKFMVIMLGWEATVSAVLSGRRQLLTNGHTEENQELNGSSCRVSCGGQELPSICLL
jgi:hypothetical protein